MSRIEITTGVATDVGRVRQGNEDSFLVEEPLFAVADGMGGHLAGDVASATAVEVISRGSAQQGFGPNMLEPLIVEANRAIWSKAQEDEGLSGMGTTCTVVLVEGSKAHLAHVGDSRAYMLRDQRLRQLTEDHTLVARMVKEGRLQPGDADRHPQRNVITRALGVDENVAVDRFEVDVEDGDRIIVCSDGLTSMMSGPEIEEILIAESDPQSAADRLVAAANEAGGDDNITVVVIEFGSSSARAHTVAGRAPERVDTSPDSTADHERKWPRTLFKALLILVVLIALGVGGARMALANSWFVGVNEDGYVTIFKGIPDEIVGLELKEQEQVTSLTLDDVPAFRQDQVSEGFKVSSREEAEEYVSNLEQLNETLPERQPTDQTPKS